MFAQFFVQVFMLPIILHVGKGDKAAGIESVMTWMAIIGTVLLLITFLTTKERVIPRPEQESSLKDDLSDLFKNRPWIIMLTLTILVFVTLAMKGGSYVYYFNNYVDEATLKSFIQPILDSLAVVGMNFFESDVASAGFGLFNAGGIICSMIGIAVSSKLANKFGKRDVFGTTLFIATLFIVSFIFYNPEDVRLMFLAQALHMFFYGVTTPILWAMIADVADYSEWVNNRRATAIIFSAMMVGLKAGLAIGGAIVTWILGLYGYVSKDAVAAGQELIQPESVAQGAKMLVSIYPSIPFLIGVALLFFYEINKSKEVQIQKDLIERRQ
jgi:Na+/melibiose symporter-like transporter